MRPAWCIADMTTADITEVAPHYHQLIVVVILIFLGGMATHKSEQLEVTRVCQPNCATTLSSLVRSCIRQFSVIRHSFRWLIDHNFMAKLIS